MSHFEISPVYDMGSSSTGRVPFTVREFSVDEEFDEFFDPDSEDLMDYAEFEPLDEYEGLEFDTVPGRCRQTFDDWEE